MGNRTRTLCLSLLVFFAGPASALEKVRLQLKWEHQFQFSGYYAAKAQGYYQEAGLDVEIIPAAPAMDSVQVVLAGEAEYGAGSSGLLLARGRGEPLVVLAVIMQHSPFILITHQEATQGGIRGLKGKRLMLEPQSDEVVALLKREGLTLDSFSEVRNDTHNMEAFINGEVDAIDGYITDEPYELMRRGVAFNVFEPRSANIDFYGDNLFTTEAEINNHPDRVRRFRQASMRGWDYAMSHPEEMIDLILAEYPTSMGRGDLTYEAQQMQQLMHPELIDIGYMLEARWRHIADTYAEFGMLPKGFSLAGFVYEEPKETDYTLLYKSMLAALVVLLVLTGVAYRFSRLNDRLQRLLLVKNQYANVGESLRSVSHQWKQPLNELAIQLMRVEQLASLLKGNAENEARELESISERGHHVLEFMGDTVDAFGHIMSGRESVEHFRPRDVVNDILVVIEETLAQQKVVIEYRSGTDAYLDGIPSRLAQVILSIVSNAKEVVTTREVNQPRISIQDSLAGDDYVLTISDNGGGVRAKKLGDIFSLGYSEKEVSDSGVGLYIARDIVRKDFNGTLEVQNDQDGAAFTLRLPLKSDV